MRARGGTLLIIAGIVAGGLAVAAWFGYYAIWLPRALGRQFVAIAARGEVAATRARIAPARRAAYDDARLRRWAEVLPGNGRVEWTRSGLGSARDGRRTCRAAGRVQGPAADKRELEAAFIQVDGVWYVDSFSLGEHAAAR